MAALLLRLLGSGQVVTRPTQRGASHVELGKTKLTGDGRVGGCFLRDVASVLGGCSRWLWMTRFEREKRGLS